MKFKFRQWYIDDAAERPYFLYILKKLSNGNYLIVNNFDGKWGWEESEHNPEDFTITASKLQLKKQSQKSLIKFIFKDWPVDD